MEGDPHGVPAPLVGGVQLHGDHRHLSGPPHAVGSGAQPTLIPEDDVRRMLGQSQSSKPKPVVTFEEGEDVRVIHGPFSSFSGVVGEVRPEKEQVQVLVAVFGRSTPVWLSYEHVEKV